MHKIIDAVEARNGAAVADLLTERSPTFTARELDKALQLAPMEPATARNSARISCTAARLSGCGKQPDSPVSRYTTRKVLKDELAVLQGADKLADHSGHGAQRRTVTEAAAKFTLIDEQAEALHQLTEKKGFGILWGEAGTGKSHTLKAVRSVYEKEGFNVVGMAHTNKVVQQMRGDGFGHAETIMSELGLESGAATWNKKTVVVVDEAAMVSTALLGKVVAAAQEAGAKLILADYSYKKRPDLINVDGDKIILCQKEDHKTLDNFIYQYKHAGLYLDRREAIDYCSEHQDEPAAQALLKLALKDPYFELRSLTMNALDMDKPEIKSAAEPVILELATKDPDRTVQGNALGILGTLKKEEYKPLFVKKTTDSSYTVAGNALYALSALDEPQAYQLAKEFYQHPAKGELEAAIVAVFIKEGDESNFDYIIEGFNRMPELSLEKVEAFPQFAALTLKMENTAQFKKAIDAIVKYRDALPATEKAEISKLINDNFLKPIADRKESAGLKEQAEYVRSRLN